VDTLAMQTIANRTIATARSGVQQNRHAKSLLQQLFVSL